ncbi:MAG: alanine racemase [Ignavibacteria bacterium]|nr:alanine racemase [Ignavibacteria bacterium]
MSYSLSEISEPTLLLDEKKCKANIQKVIEKVNSLGIQFRPHFKTHQSKHIANWFEEFGVEKIAVSSLKMAKYFAQANWKDILIAFPLNLRSFDEALQLSELIEIKFTISDISVLEYLNNVTNFPIKFYLEIDVNATRSGFDIENYFEIEKAIKIFKKNPNLVLIGLLAHNNQTYLQNSQEGVIKSNNIFLSKLAELKSFFLDNGFEVILSVGDTPSISICEEFPSVDELRPGNFVFYDVMQTQIGSCSVNEIAVCVAAPIVAIYHNRSEIVCYAGSVHLSKEHFSLGEAKVYGLIVELQNNTWGLPLENSYVREVYQEHSLVKIDYSLLKKFKVGDLIGILPVHSCLTADCFRNYLIPGFGFIDHMS